MHGEPLVPGVHLFPGESFHTGKGGGGGGGGGGGIIQH